jgi:hypothetical protein
MRIFFDPFVTSVYNPWWNLSDIGMINKVSIYNSMPLTENILSNK